MISAYDDDEKPKRTSHRVNARDRQPVEAIDMTGL